MRNSHTRRLLTDPHRRWHALLAVVATGLLLAGAAPLLPRVAEARHLPCEDGAPPCDVVAALAIKGGPTFSPGSRHALSATAPTASRAATASGGARPRQGGGHDAAGRFVLLAVLVTVAVRVVWRSGLPEVTRAASRS